MTLAWVGFATLLLSLADGRGHMRLHVPGDAMQATRSQLTGWAHVSSDLRTGSLPNPAVRHTTRFLDVNNLTADAFGDNDVSPVTVR